MPTTGVGSEILATRLFNDLVGTLNATLPPVDIFDDAHSVPWPPGSEVFQPVTRPTIAELTGYFDALLAAFRIPLEEQFTKSRITGGDYAKTFVALSQQAMQSAVQFALGRDQSFWMSVKTQADAINSLNQNELTRMQIMLARAQFARTKLELSTQDSQFGVSELQRTDVLPGQVLLTQEQRLMVHEQMEGQRAQTLDTRQDGQSRDTAVQLPDGTSEARTQGLLGVQSYLYRQQIMSYREDGKVKAAKLFSDLWMTMKTMDDGLQPSDWFRPPAPGQSTPLDSVFRSARNIAIGNTTDPWSPTTPP